MLKNLTLAATFLHFHTRFRLRHQTIVSFIQTCSIFQCFGSFSHKGFPGRFLYGLLHGFKVALSKLVVAKLQSVLLALVCGSVQQFKNMHSTIGAFEVSLFVFLLEPVLMLVVLLAFNIKWGK